MRFFYLPSFRSLFGFASSKYFRSNPLSELKLTQRRFAVAPQKKPKPTTTEVKAWLMRLFVQRTGTLNDRTTDGLFAFHNFSAAIREHRFLHF